MKPRSWWPVLTSLGLIAFGWWLATRHHEHGRHGPDVQPGAFPVETEAFLPALDPERFPLTVEVETIADPLATGAGDRRTGVSVVHWHEVGIVLEDHHPLTRSVARALAEHLTGFVAANGEPSPVGADRNAQWVWLLPPGESARLPYQMRRILRVSTPAPSGLDFSKYDRQQPLPVRVRVHHQDILPPSVREHSGLVAAPGVLERSLDLVVEVPPTGVEIAWSDWHLSLGRRIAADALRGLLADAPAGATWNEPPGDRAAIASRVSTGIESVAAWQSTIDDPPRTEVDRWFGVFQTPLVRGWGGVIVGTTVPDVKKGGERPTIEVFSETVGDEKWSAPEIDSESGRHLWRATDVGDLDILIAEPRAWGWNLVAYEVNLRAAEIVSAWVAAAAEGDVQARRHLRDHSHAAGLPDAVLERVLAVLATEPDLADRCALGRADASSVENRSALRWTEWVRGIQVERPAAVPRGSMAPAQLSLGLSDPVAVVSEEWGAVLLPDPRSTVSGWYRPHDGTTRCLEGVATVEASLGITIPIAETAVTDTPFSDSP